MRPLNPERRTPAQAGRRAIRASLAATALGLAALSAGAQADHVAAASAAALTPIPALDLPRYLGHWYEIAKYPNRFQKQCVSDTQADYRLLPDGMLRVLNRCRLADGNADVAVGMARQLGGADSARLEVRFAPAWLSFIPAVWGDYWVVDLDPDYQLAAVSEPRREFLWILARQPEVDAAAYAALLERLAGMGFDLGRLVKTTHGDGSDAAAQPAP
jgi:apolipoprotein D and lipocalin family protein